MRQRDELGVELHARAERRGQGRSDAIVSPFDAVHRASRRRVVRGKLVDERDQRELLGIGEKKSAHPGGGCTQLAIGLHFVEPLRYGSAREVGRHRRVPALLGEPVAAGQIGEPVVERRARSRTRRAGCA